MSKLTRNQKQFPVNSAVILIFFENDINLPPLYSVGTVYSHNGFSGADVNVDFSDIIVECDAGWLRRRV